MRERFQGRIKRRRLLTPEVRREVIRFAAQGLSYREIIDRAGVSSGAVGLIVKPVGGVYRSHGWEPGEGRLSLDDRVEIKLGIDRGESFAGIGRRLGYVTSTISREVGGMEGRGVYRPMDAHRAAADRARRPKPTRLSSNPRLCRYVVDGLEQLWSPEQIAGRLCLEFPDDAEMRVSHETIYKSVFIEGRGELRRELARCLRTGRAARKPRGRIEKRGKIVDMVPIAERPDDVAGRQIAGHWEGDLILGSGNKSAVGTLVERTSRLTLLLHLPEDHTAASVRVAAAQTFQTLPDAMRRTLTWDQGSEMAEHAQFTIDTGIDVYFCDPHAPWQRPTNENTNGLLRQYLPKGTDLSTHTTDDLAAIADSLNSRPRKVLGYLTPSEAFAQIVASTA